MTVKIEALVGEIPQPFEYGHVFAREDVGGQARLRVGLNEAQDACVPTFASGLSGPFQLLDVLHTTRTGAELGRYESPELTSAVVEEFFNEFGRFFCEDSPHDLWVRCATRAERDGRRAALRISRKTFSTILNKRAGISAEMALRLAQALGTTAERWLTLQLHYDLWHAQRLMKVRVPRLARALDMHAPRRGARPPHA